MRNVKLVLEYDGTDFYGWQRQSKGRTVQGELESALKSLLNERVTAIAAGRTDSGVHALGQVVNFKTKSKLDTETIYRGLNNYLAHDVRVLSAENIDENFHARFDAKDRTYRYVISKRNRAVGRTYAWFCSYILNLDLIREASEYFLGEHKFTAFAKLNPEESHYLSHVKYLHWAETNDHFTLEICATRFLHKMVRMVVGTLVDVGRGKVPPQQVQKILQSEDRTLAAAAVPARGLFLLKVGY